MLHLDEAEGTSEIVFVAAEGGAVSDYVMTANGAGSVSFNVEAGKSTHIMVGYESNLSEIPGGEFSFHWEFFARPQLDAPVITGEVVPGSAVNISVKATGEGELTYTWFRDGQLVRWETEANLTLDSLSPELAGTYQMFVSSRGGVGRSEKINIGGPGLGPLIVQQPVGGVVTSGSAVTLQVSATGTGPMSYQWRKHGVDIPGATSAQLDFGQVKMLDSNIYDVRVSDALSSRVSDAVRLWVDAEKQLDHLAFRSDWEVRIDKRESHIQVVAASINGGYWVAGDISRFGDARVNRIFKLTPEGVLDSTFQFSGDFYGPISGVAETIDGGLWVWGAIGKNAGGVGFSGGIIYLSATGDVRRRYDVAQWDTSYLTGAGVDGEGNLYAKLGYQLEEEKLIRFSADGSWDSSFAPLATEVDRATGIAVNTHGVVLVWSSNELKRIDESGVIDDEFGFDMGGWGKLMKVAAGPDGTFTVLGTTGTSTFAIREPLEWRRFDSEGVELVDEAGSAVITADIGNYREVHQMTVDAAGSILVSGETGKYDGRLWRISPGNPSTGVEQLARFTEASSRAEYAYYARQGNFALGQDGHILIGGAFGLLEGLPVAQLGLLVDGEAIQALAESTWSQGAVSAMVMQTDGKVVMGGNFDLVNGTESSGLARFTADGELDGGFGSGLPDLLGPITDVVTDTAGRLLIAGYVRTADGGRGSLRTRLSSEGIEDELFAQQSGRPREETAYGLITLMGGRSLVTRGWYGNIDNVFWYSDLGDAIDYRGIESGRLWAAREQVDGSVVFSGQYGGTGPGLGRGLMNQNTALVRTRSDGSVDPFFGAGNSIKGTFLESALFADESSLHMGTSSRVKLDRDGWVDSGYRQHSWTYQNHDNFAAIPLGDGRLQLAGDVRVLWLGGDALSADRARSWVRVNADGTLDETVQLRDLDGTVNAMLQRDDGQYYIAIPGRVKLTEELELKILVQPESRFSPLDSTVRLEVEGDGEGLTYQWRKNGVAIAGATDAVLELSSLGLENQGAYDVIVGRGTQRIVSDPAIVAIAEGDGFGVSGHQQVGVGNSDSPRTLLITNTAIYTGEMQDLLWSVLVPEGWTISPLIDGTVLQAADYPVAGATGLGEWRWSSLPASGFSFSYELSPMADLRGEFDLVAMFTGLRVGGTSVGLVSPDPLTVRARPLFHDADFDQDNRLSLGELLRVIELYNTRFGSLRSGRYQLREDSVDGFDPDASGTEGTVLTRYHVADSSRDGKISLSELLRVIELYNTRSGSARTGAYRFAADSIDGFTSDVAENQP